MEDKKPRSFACGPLYKEAEALSLSVATIRNARGKKNPRDFAVNSPEWHQTCHEFANDILGALGGTQFAADLERKQVNQQPLHEKRLEQERRKES